MKNRILYTCFCFVLLSAQCTKGNLSGTDIPGLPPATQIGANTFGFLLNGQPWVPSGNNGGGNNLSISHDSGFRNGVIGIAAYRTLPNRNYDEHFGMGFWALNTSTFPLSASFIDTTRTFAGFYTDTNCWLTSHYADVKTVGFLSIDVYDKQKRIIAGRFDFTLEKIGCPIIRISKGRFDFKF
jgi:hypothetical protein